MIYLKSGDINLTAIGSSKGKEYQNNSPFPHIVFHDLFSEEILDIVLEEFPDLSKLKGRKEYDKEHELKLASFEELHFEPKTKEFLRYLNSKSFIDFLEVLTGINGLIPDPHFLGGGLHELKNNGFLNIHVDFNHHPRMNLDRRINLLIYLNKDWTEENGGQLELWDREMKNCSKSVVPEYNTTVVFTTTDYSYHGNPNPVNCADDNSRKSIALFYYSNGRPEEEINPGLENLSSLFKLKPGQKLRHTGNTAHSLKKTISLFIPPIVFKVRDALLK